MGLRRQGRGGGLLRRLQGREGMQNNASQPSVGEGQDTEIEKVKLKH